MSYETLKAKIEALIGKVATSFQEGKEAGNTAKLASVLRFQNIQFPDGYEMELNCQNLTELPSFSGSSGIRKVTYNIPINRDWPCNNTFYGNKSIEEIVFPDGICMAAANYFCTNVTTLRKIVGRMDFRAVKNTNMFTGAAGLVDISFVPKTIGATIDFARSSLLSEESVQSIIDALADLTGQAAQKVSFHTEVLAKLRADQFSAIAAKNWTV